ncbi:telomerase ribonucleoprotein complex - RNA binding domain containing protein [Nitzschia inconspicua]|uniref:Telomerase reverse transcriptase n=1 Tax=Nitzschia inconspicua TaxID=303405 RepID=A0A9K3LUD1_9STRA|nr:telomerase ribonucleoprotein complex - RNA binding domain containing protein [Nitzschia inconspicua]
MNATKATCTVTSSSSTSLCTVRRLLSAGTKVYTLLDFVKEYSPSIKLDLDQEIPSQILEILIAPTETCTVLRHVRAPECREPLHTMIDDVVWLLIQRRAQSKRRGEDFKNALLQGFVAAREGETAPPGMRLGVARSHQNSINENVGYCKQSPIIHQLHALVGDEIFRMIFAHTRLFLPLLENDGEKKRGSYILLCGPPLPNPGYIAGTKGTIISSSVIDRKRKNENGGRGRKRKRRKVSSHSCIMSSDGESLLRPNDCLSRFALFYVDTYAPRVGLPQSHVFHKSPSCSAQELLTKMLNLSRENKNKQRRIRKRLGETGLKICQGILRGHSTCDYHRLLDRYCSLPDDLVVKAKVNDDENGSDRLSRLAKAFTPQDRIVSFLTAVLRRVFPREFWGSEANFMTVMASVNSFVHLRRRERLANKNLMHGCRVTHLKWLFPAWIEEGSKNKPRRSHQTATSLVLTTLRWLFQGFLIPLLRTNFYVTETEFSVHKVHYYRRPVWSLFRSLSVKKFVGGQHFSQISYSTTKALLRDHYMGISRLRLLPKATGVRPIAQLSRRQTVNFLWNVDSCISRNPSLSKKINNRNKRQGLGKVTTLPSEATTALPTVQTYLPPRFLPTNVVLGEVFDILRYECGRQKHVFGTGIDSLELFYPKYRLFISRTRERHKSDGFRLFLASIDIEKCFDRIDQSSLLEFVTNLITHNSYIIQLVKLHSSLTDDKTKDNVARIRFTKVVEPLDLYQPVHVGQQSLGRDGHHCVLDLTSCTLAERNKLLQMLQEHICSNLVVTSGRFRKKVLIQSCGISQGSKLSTTLCNVYYGKVEESMFGDKEEIDLQNEGDDFTSRFVDDFLFISTKRERIERFMSMSYRGVPSLGAQVNPEKSSVSSDMTIVWETAAGDVSTTRLQNGCRQDPTGRSLFPWCGLLFDAQNGEVFMDYERFHGKKPLDSLTVDCAGEEGKRIKYRMQSFVFPRCLPILFDPSINSFDTIVLNFEQMMLFAAVKTAHYLRTLALVTRNEKHNVNHILQCIQGLSVFAARSIASKSKCFQTERREFEFQLGHSLSNWLTWKAFHTVFSPMSDFVDLKRGITARLQPFESLRIPTNQRSSVCCAVSRALESFRLIRFIQ